MPLDTGGGFGGRIKGTDPRVRAVADRIGRGTMDSPRESVAGGGKVKPAAVRGRGQVGLAYDDDPKAYGWHYSPAENAEGIRQHGLDPRQAGRHGDFSRGVHFSDSPHTYEPLGDRDFNVYRVRKDAIENPVHRSEGDFYTEHRIPPEMIEAYEGPGRFGKLADAGSTAVGLMGLLGTAATFIPGFSERMPRTTWLANGGPMGDLLQEVIAGNYRPGGAMDPYKNWAPDNQQGGTVLA